MGDPEVGPILLTMRPLPHRVGTATLFVNLLDAMPANRRLGFRAISRNVSKSSLLRKRDGACSCWISPLAPINSKTACARKRCPLSFLPTSNRFLKIPPREQISLIGCLSRIYSDLYRRGNEGSEAIAVNLDLPSPAF